MTRLPPGPRGLPILGNLLMLGEFPHRDLHRLAKKHGPIMYMRLGFVPAIIVSSPQAAEQFLKTHNLIIFANRSFVEAAKYISYDRTGMSFCEYGAYWRYIQELGLLIQSLKDSADADMAADLSAKVSSLSADMTGLMVLGKKYMDNAVDERGFKAVIQEGMHIAAVPNIADFIPYIGPLDLQGLARRMKAISKSYDDFMEKIIDEHVQAGDERRNRDLVDVLLSFMGSNETEFPINRSNIKAIILTSTPSPELVQRNATVAAMNWTWTSLVFIVLAYLLRALGRKGKKKHIRLPPGPRGIPILGNLHMLGEFPHRDLHRLAMEHGPIMYMRLGFVPTIIVSSPQAAELFLKTHDLIFASRPFVEAAKYISYNRTGVSFCEYGAYWRYIRKLCTLEMLSNLKINSFKSMRREELGLLIQSLMDPAKAGMAADLSAMVSSLSADMSCLMIFGKKYTDNDIDERGFKACIQEGMHLAAVPNMADFIPYIGALDLQGLARRMKAISKVFDNFFEKIIDEHIQAGDEERNRDLVDVMLSVMGSNETEFPITRSNIKAIILRALRNHCNAMNWTWTSLVFILLTYLLHALRNKWKKKHMIRLPPGPRGLPILGNLLMLGEFPHRDLHRLAKKHGPIMYMRLGFVPAIIVSSPQAAEQFLKTHDLIFANRPFVEAAKYIAYDRTGLSFCEYGDYWRYIRKLCTLEMLSNVKINTFKSMRREELGLLIQSLKKDSADADMATDLSAKVSSLIADMSCLMIFGKKYMDSAIDERGFKAVFLEAMQLGAAPNMADFIPYIGALDLQGLARRMKAISKVFDDFFEKIIDEHVQAGDEGRNSNFVDVLLSFMGSNETEFPITRSNIKAIILVKAIEEDEEDTEEFLASSSTEHEDEESSEEAVRGETEVQYISESEGDDDPSSSTGEESEVARGSFIMRPQEEALRTPIHDIARENITDLEEDMTVLANEFVNIRGSTQAAPSSKPPLTMPQIPHLQGTLFLLWLLESIYKVLLSMHWKTVIDLSKKDLRHWRTILEDAYAIGVEIEWLLQHLDELSAAHEFRERLVAAERENEQHISTMKMLDNIEKDAAERVKQA
ncbi:hypothetical protein HHK36_004090 [Tetracentron sinense]|uniref:Cytochrome P450 n=1 Tax=Tetracentron sinense TaxID=13715 RepID=A0A834ZQJ2_TETSI|nr:hypothetical protein HHK36_004090 [Tetracentron sinense]